jgi:hypothetical protein
MDTNDFHELGGGLTILSLLSVLVQNFLLRKREDFTIGEKMSRVSKQLEELSRQQGELLLLHTTNVHKLELLLQGVHGEQQLLQQRQQEIRELQRLR